MTKHEVVGEPLGIPKAIRETVHQSLVDVLAIWWTAHRISVDRRGQLIAPSKLPLLAKMQVKDGRKHASWDPADLAFLYPCDGWGEFNLDQILDSGLVERPLDVALQFATTLSTSLGLSWRAWSKEHLLQRRTYSDQEEAIESAVLSLRQIIRQYRGYSTDRLIQRVDQGLWSACIVLAELLARSYWKRSHGGSRIGATAYYQLAKTDLSFFDQLVRDLQEGDGSNEELFNYGSNGRSGLNHDRLRELGFGQALGCPVAHVPSEDLLALLRAQGHFGHERVVALQLWNMVQPVFDHAIDTWLESRPHFEHRWETIKSGCLTERSCKLLFECRL